MLRQPISHEWSWNQGDNEYPDSYENENYKLEAEKRYEDIIENMDSNTIDKLQDYDIITNIKVAGYRNNGVFIYYNKGIYNLSARPDDYGSLPKWVKLQKDLGWSYFNNYLIDHNYCTPFKTSEWEICNSYVKKDNIKFPMYNCEIVTNIKRNDGVEAIILSVVNISFPSMGGPSYDIIKGTAGGGSETWYQNYTDRHGGKFKITSYKKTGKIIVSRDEYDIEVPQEQRITMKSNVTLEACKVTNNKMKDKFNKNEYLYFEAFSEREFDDSWYRYETVIAAKLDENNTEEIPVYTVIPYQYEID
jgi:hypothetical protein